MKRHMNYRTVAHDANHLDIEQWCTAPDGSELWVVIKCYDDNRKDNLMGYRNRSIKSLLDELSEKASPATPEIKAWAADVVQQLREWHKKQDAFNVEQLTTAEYGEAPDPETARTAEWLGDAELKSDLIRDEWLGRFEGYYVREILDKGFTFNQHRREVYNRYCKIVSESMRPQ